MIMMAFAVISQSLDDGAIAGFGTTGTGHRDPFEFAFEQPKPGNLVADIAEMRDGDGVRIIAGHVRLVGEPEKCPDALDREPEIARMPDEGQPLAVSTPITPLIAFRPLRFRQKTNLFVVANRLDLDTGLLGHCADRQNALEERFG